ncbi:hypothetical protein QVD17_34608 [Tagetes erecta]|uniref:Uncharacterized protein n=1 Tax=Tagetes erecta TaxID=13708 RepID=A0AAD8NLZ0_TARER|nr:hypothetical protein QVD17_34608 [Tagetes erecta]
MSFLRPLGSLDRYDDEEDDDSVGFVISYCDSLRYFDEEKDELPSVNDGRDVGGDSPEEDRESGCNNDDCDLPCIGKEELCIEKLRENSKKTTIGRQKVTQDDSTQHMGSDDVGIGPHDLGRESHGAFVGLHVSEVGVVLNQAQVRVNMADRPNLEENMNVGGVGLFSNPLGGSAKVGAGNIAGASNTSRHKGIRKGPNHSLKLKDRRWFPKSKPHSFAKSSEGKVARDGKSKESDTRSAESSSNSLEGEVQGTLEVGGAVGFRVSDQEDKNNTFKRLSREEAEAMVSPFLSSEIKAAVWECGGDKPREGPLVQAATQLL